MKKRKMNSNSSKAIFLDRDGVINVDHGHVYRIEDFDFVEGVFDLCATAQNNDYLLIIVTNQAGIGKGYYTEKDFVHLNDWMIDTFRKKGIYITRTYHCPHSPEEGCLCRKPNPGMILRAIKDYSIDVSKSILIGDKSSDIEAGKKAGVQHTFLFNGVDHYQTIETLKNMLLV